MPYTLRALVARRDVFARTPPWIADSAVIGLPQGFAMVPLTQALRWQFGPADRPWLYAADARFLHLPQALVPHVEALSRGGRVAYLEAEYHGGDGEQRSMVWEDGAPPGAPDEGSYAINAALARLGVEPAEGADRFDTLGLGATAARRTGRRASARPWCRRARRRLRRPKRSRRRRPHGAAGASGASASALVGAALIRRGPAFPLTGVIHDHRPGVAPRGRVPG